MKPIEEISPVSSETFESEIRPQFRPVVMRGIAKDWPAVAHAREGQQSVLNYISQLDTGTPAEVMLAPEKERGRFFYSPDMRGFNFRREHLSLRDLAAHLATIADHPEPIGIYAGAAAMAEHAPRFAQENPFPLMDGIACVPRLWLGNATQVATHFDLSDNFAVVALGKRRFTLFPPEATPDLYVGPLNITLAGQPVSMVNPLEPDLEKYPRYAKALEHAQFVDLEPGDALYIPTLWWHHVAASAPVNLLVNYWHNDAQRGGGFLALVHTMLAIREQPVPQRDAWRHWFEHFVFGPEAGQAADHLPPEGQGINGPASPQRDEMMRQFIVQILSARG